MQLHAIKIQKSQNSLLGYLNGGVIPKTEKKPTWLIFDVDEEVPNRIITESEFYQTFDISERSPIVFFLKK
jgi:hypothetical protein